ncbi:uncharacterized protein LOC143887605 isoform X2 [Tasmannia lanceolata]|uniref:uncharacterized protein LOC143887605 isoform X2 n=1 Tax=Tasmannia lanceolata TaxID=3420 RepID=UPI0040641973
MRREFYLQHLKPQRISSPESFVSLTASTSYTALLSASGRGRRKLLGRQGRHTILFPLSEIRSPVQWYRDSAELREGWKNEYLVEACNRFGLCIRRETHPPSATCCIRGRAL